MALAKKILNGAQKGAKVADKLFFKPNTLADDGGLSSFIVPRKLNGLGIGVALAGTTALRVGDVGLQARNRNKAGYIRYNDGMTRMTNSFTSGVVPAMMRASEGNYGVFSDMAEEVVTNKGLGGIDDYGVTPSMISALYNMGGK